MPLFALVNAGVSLEGLSPTVETMRTAAGVSLGLLLGKPIGVLLAISVLVALGWGRLPAGVGRRQLAVLGLVAGVGFTMSLFVAQLAFSDPQLLGAAKTGVLGASVLAALAALTVGRIALVEERSRDVAESADAAETSTEA